LHFSARTNIAVHWFLSSLLCHGWLCSSCKMVLRIAVFLLPGAHHGVHGVV
jgi:hypothetical protein